jgi:hypothetical protein
MTWHRAKYAHGRYFWGNYTCQKEHSRLGDVWTLKYNGVEVSQSTTFRAAKEDAYEHFQKALATLRNNGL